MWRYLRLYGHFIRFSFSRAMEFRIDLSFRILMDLIFYLVSFGFYKVIYQHTQLLGGWTENQVMIFVASFCILDAVSMVALANNQYWLPQFVNRGDLDYYIVRPVSSLFFLSLRDFSASSLLNLILAISFFFYFIGQSPHSYSAGSILLHFILLGLGLLLHYSVRMFLIIPVFWTHSPTSLHHVFFSVERILEKPDAIFTGWARRIFTTVLPFSVMVSFPSRIFFEGFNWGVFLHVLGVTAAFFCGTVWFWKVGLRAYSSASS